MKTIIKFNVCSNRETIESCRGIPEFLYGELADMVIHAKAGALKNLKMPYGIECDYSWKSDFSHWNGGYGENMRVELIIEEGDEEGDEIWLDEEAIGQAKSIISEALWAAESEAEKEFEIIFATENAEIARLEAEEIAE